MDTQQYWHFVQVDEEGTPRSEYGDKRVVKVGETLTVEGTPVLCEFGLHASKRLGDALAYATGAHLSLCRVTLGGKVVHDDDKSVATERTVTAMLSPEATEQLLRGFARWCALQVIHLWDAPDVVRQYLETGDESLRAAAWAAASAAAWAATSAAASAAAWAAAWAAAREQCAAELERRALEAIGEQP
jgi:hypothetical protein